LDLATLLKEKCFIVVIGFEGSNVECGKIAKDVIIEEKTMFDFEMNGPFSEEWKNMGTKSTIKLKIYVSDFVWFDSILKKESKI
jgi:hypothetical protein